jgi:hypothetical protein
MSQIASGLIDEWVKQNETSPPQQSKWNSDALQHPRIKLQSNCSFFPRFASLRSNRERVTCKSVEVLWWCNATFCSTSSYCYDDFFPNISRSYY